MEEARRNISTAAEASARQANKKRRDITFAPGNYVYLRTTHLALPRQLSRKLAAQWIGPFAVESAISSVAYRLHLPPRYSRLHPVFHANEAP